MPLISATGTLALASLAICVLWFRLGQRDSIRLPPGPSRLPLLGSVHHLPQEYQHKKFFELAKTHGDVMYMQLFSWPAVVLGSVKAAQDLFEKRSSIYSDRPRFTLVAEMGFDLAMSIMPYGDQWRRHRKWFAAAFLDKKALESYVPIQRRETYKLLAGLLETPGAYHAHIRRYVGAVMMEVAYGHRVTSLDDEIVVLAEKAVGAATEAGSPAATLIDFLPFFQWIPAWMPGGGWKTRAAEVRKMVDKTSDVPYGRLKAAIAAGNARPCFLWSLLEEVPKPEFCGTATEETVQEIKAAANLVYGAGIDTTATTLGAFVLCMVLHPECCKKAQEEIDRVVGNLRLPDYEDRSSLPYTEAVLKEVFRWIPPVPLGLPHRLTQTDSYRSYTIPQGTMTIPNIWGMTRDASMYPEPEVFRPERFLEMDVATVDPRNMVFGFGRRICPGKDFGDATVWLAAVNMLAAFDIRKARDDTRREVTPIPSFSSGMISHVRPFVCDIRPRSQKVAQMIELADISN